jgi:regulator of protease activity HflC (stomatin/prohibitin superfamily)
VAVIVVALALVRAVPPQYAYVVELFGHYRRTLEPGVHLAVPFIESVRAKVDMGEQVANLWSEPAITMDSIVACISAVVYYRVEDPVRATYEVARYPEAMRMLTATTLRNLIGSMDLERARSSGVEIGSQLTRGLREHTGAWGIGVGPDGDHSDRDRLALGLRLIDHARLEDAA